jgi:predicted Fe-Mo cluster-binding NifX family protein
MKIGISLFNHRVSPLFDDCPEIWIVELRNGQVVNQETWAVENCHLQDRIDRLAANGVEKIICGGIDSNCMDRLEHRGIDVLYNVAGEAGDVLDLFLRGRLRPGIYCDGKRGRGFHGWRWGPRGRRNVGNQRKM